MNTLRLFVAGLVALVPSNDRKAMKLVLKSMQKAPNPLDRHYPVLVWNAAQATTGKPNHGNLIQKKLNLFREPSGLILDGRILSISGVEGGGLSGLRRASKPRPSSKVPVDTVHGRSTDWLVSMGDVAPGHGTIAKKYYQAPYSRDLAAILDLSGLKGEVSVFGLADVKNGGGGKERYVHSFKFYPRGKPKDEADVHQAVADFIVVQLTLEAAKKVKITATPIGGGADEVVDLELQDRDCSIDVVLGNLTPLGCPPASPACDDGGEHFAHYYDLSSAAMKPPRGDRRMPFCGSWSDKVRRVHVEPSGGEIPDVVVILTEPDCSKIPPPSGTTWLAAKGGGGGINRPICTVVSFEAP